MDPLERSYLARLADAGLKSVPQIGGTIVRPAVVGRVMSRLVRQGLAHKVVAGRVRYVITQAGLEALHHEQLEIAEVLQ